MILRTLIAAAFAATLLLISGCGTYQLQGRVVHGSHADVAVVDPDDPRLEAAGVGGANVRLTIDPESLGREILPTQQTRPDGSFSIPVEEFGAGTLEYNAALLVRKEGHQHALGEFPLPGAGKRVLVVLPRGDDRFSEPDDPRDDLDRFGFD